MSNSSENTGYPTLEALYAELSNLTRHQGDTRELLRFIQAERQVIALETIALAQASKVAEENSKGVLNQVFDALEEMGREDGSMHGKLEFGEFLSGFGRNALLDEYHDE